MPVTATMRLYSRLINFNTNIFCANIKTAY